MQSGATVSSMTRKQELLLPDITRSFFFFKRVDRIETSKEPEPVALMSGVREIAACPPYPITDDPLALPSPTSSPFSSQ